MTMNEKHREVHAWLDKLFGGDEIPQYEINPRTTEILWDLMKKNEYQDRVKTLILQDLQCKADEYNAEAERLSKVLHRLGLSPNALSQSGAQSLRTLVTITLLLEVRDASTTSIALGMTEAQEAHMKLREARRAEQKTSSQLFSKTKAALLRYNTLKKALENLDEQVKCEEPEMQKKVKLTGFLHSKAKEYHKQINNSQLELAKNGATPELYHHNLVKKAEELKQLRDKLQPMKAKLDSYHSIPPDLSLAKVKLEEAKNELACLEEELSKHIDLIHL